MYVCCGPGKHKKRRYIVIFEESRKMDSIPSAASKIP
jgi:hypothetical protein